jgi:hypothetical protein
MTTKKAVSKVKSINRKGRKVPSRPVPIAIGSYRELSGAIGITQRTQRFVSQCFDFAPFAITSCTLRLKKTFKTA